MDALHTYFDGERQAGLCAALLGLISCAFATWLWSTTSTFRAMLVPLGTLFLLIYLARPFRRHLPGTCGAVRGLIGDIVPRNLGTLTVRIGRRPTDDETFDVLRQLIADLLGVKPEAVTLEARFVEDLGLD